MASQRNVSSGSWTCPNCSIPLRTAGNPLFGTCRREWTVGCPPQQCCGCALNGTIWMFSEFKSKGCTECTSRKLGSLQDRLAQEETARKQAEQQLRNKERDLQDALARFQGALQPCEQKLAFQRERADQAELLVQECTAEAEDFKAFLTEQRTGAAQEAQQAKAEAQRQVWEAQQKMREVEEEAQRQVLETQQKMREVEEESQRQVQAAQQKMREVEVESQRQVRKARNEALRQVQSEKVADGEKDTWTVIGAATKHQFLDIGQEIKRIVTGPHSKLCDMIKAQCLQIDSYRAADRKGNKLNPISRAQDLARLFVRAEHSLKEARDEVANQLGESLVTSLGKVLEAKKKARNIAMQQVVEAAQALEGECTEQVVRDVQEHKEFLKNSAIPTAKQIQENLGKNTLVVSPGRSKEDVLDSASREFDKWVEAEEAEAALRKEHIIEAQKQLAVVLNQCAEALNSEREMPKASEDARNQVLKLAKCIEGEASWVRECCTRSKHVRKQVTRATSALLDSLEEEKLELSMLLKAREKARAVVADGTLPDSDQRLRERLNAIKQRMVEADEEEFNANQDAERLKMHRRIGKPVDENEQRAASAKQRECKTQTVRLQRAIQAEWTKTYLLQDAFPELPIEIAQEFPQIFGGDLPQEGQLFKPLRKKSQYSDVQLLSQGGTDSRNSVWKATWEEPDAEPQEVVLKEFVLNREMNLKVIQRELKTLQRLDHVHVIKPDLWFLEQEREGPGLVCYVQFRWYETDMRKWLENTEEAKTQEHVHQVLHDVLRGLEHVHYHKVVHCDVKPENVLLGPRQAHGIRRAVLADFDLSLDQEQWRKQTVTVSMASMSVVGPRGTPGLLTFAPEVNQGKEPTAKSDMYSFGGLALEALYGQEAATCKTRGEGQFWDGDGVPRLEGVAPEHVLLLRLLSRMPENRPTSAEAHDDDMFAVEAAVKIMQGQREIESLRSNAEQKLRESKALERQLAAAQQEQQVMAREKQQKEQEIAQQLEARQALEREKNELQVRMDGQLARGEAQSAELQQRLEQKRHEGRQRDEALHCLQQVQARSDEEKRRAQDKVRKLLAESSTAQLKLKEAEARHARERSGLAQLMKMRPPHYWTHDTGKGQSLVNNTRFMGKLVQEWIRHAVDRNHACSRSCSSVGPGPSKLQHAKVTKVQRIEILTSWDIYQARKRALAHQIAEFEKQGIRLPLLKTKTHQPNLPDMELDANVNELFLFHGTSTLEVGMTIAEQGMDHRVAADTGLYGAGSYFADWSCKSAQYTDRPPSGTHVFLLCRVLMGFPCMIRGNAKKLMRPDNIQTTDRPCDSIFAERRVANNGNQEHNEYVVFENSQVYPEYLVQFTVP